LCVCVCVCVCVCNTLPSRQMETTQGQFDVRKLQRGVYGGKCQNICVGPRIYVDKGACVFVCARACVIIHDAPRLQGAESVRSRQGCNLKEMAKKNSHAVVER